MSDQRKSTMTIEIPASMTEPAQENVEAPETNGSLVVPESALPAETKPKKPPKPPKKPLNSKQLEKASKDAVDGKTLMERLTAQTNIGRTVKEKYPVAPIARWMCVWTHEETQFLRKLCAESLADPRATVEDKRKLIRDMTVLVNMELDICKLLMQAAKLDPDGPIPVPKEMIAGFSKGQLLGPSPKAPPPLNFNITTDMLVVRPEEKK